jgi:FlaA1/EpsC-like NDP-sugar epimerase
MRSFVPRGRHLFVYDLVVTLMAVVLAFTLRFDASAIGTRLATYLPVALLPLLVMPPVYALFGLYRREWRYASIQEMYLIVFAVLVGTTISTLAFLALAVAHFPGTAGYPRLVFAIEALLYVAFVGGGRFALRANLERRGISGGTDEELGLVPTIVYGAGETGAMVARVASRDPAAHLNIVGFIDDDDKKRGSRLLGKRVFGGADALPKAVRDTHARQLLVAMPTASGAAIRRAFERGRQLGLEVRTVPHPRELLSGETLVGQIRRVSVDDLLRRDAVEIDTEAVSHYLSGASVLVTGGGGSIGSELVRQILAVGPRVITVLDNHEEALWSIERELSERVSGSPGVQFEPILADVRSGEAVDAIFARLKPEVVFHAAALKHVPIVELAPAEGVMTNVVGTRNVLDACERSGVERFVLISTDKAVEPVGAMGATKRMAELLTVASARRTGRPYAAVRFGNVLGSSGSVIPTFQRQLEKGHPITITHPDATRYFMTIPEAVSLILQAGATAGSGEIYVLDMGKPIKITDLARDLIRLSGLDPDRVPIVYTGLRAGERLHEALFYDHETTERTGHEAILRVRADLSAATREPLDGLYARLEQAARRRDDDVVRDLLRDVPALGGPASTQKRSVVARTKARASGASGASGASEKRR